MQLLIPVRGLVAALLMSLAVGVAHAEAPTYVLIGAQEDLSQWGFLDVTTVQREGARVTVWTLWVNKPAVAVGDRYIGYARRQYVYDCRARHSEMIFVELFDEKFAALPYAQHPGAEAARPVPWQPMTINELAGSIVCEGAALPHTDKRYTIRQAVEAVFRWAEPPRGQPI